MMADFPVRVSNIKTLLYAEDISLYTKVKTPQDAEQILQPYLDEIYRWGCVWKFDFPPEKASAVIFTKSYKPGKDLLLFMHGNRIKTETQVKFLGIIFYHKLIWKYHINMVITHCIGLKHLFLAITSIKSGPSMKTLGTLFSSLVQSKLDYGLIAYGTASVSNLKKVDIDIRTIIRIILGSRSTTTIEAIHVDSCIPPIMQRRARLAGSRSPKRHQGPIKPQPWPFLTPLFADSIRKNPL